MGTLESSFFGQPSEDDAAAPTTIKTTWLDRLSAWLPLSGGDRAFRPADYMTAYGAAPGLNDARRPLIPESLSRWSTGLKSPLGSGGPGGFLNREKWLILGVTLFILFWTIMYALFSFVPKFESKATVIVKDSAITGSYVAANNFGGQTPTTSSSASNPVLNMIGIINSSNVRRALYDYYANFHKDVLDKYKIKSVEDWETFYGDGTSFLKAKNMPGTDLIQINFTWDEPKTARESLRILLKAFQDESLNINQAEQRNRSRYLDIQVDELTKKLEVVRKQKSDYKTRVNVIAQQKQADEMTKSRLDLNTQLNAVLSKARGKAAEAARYERMLNMTADQAVEAAGVGLNTSMAKLYDQLYALRQTEATLLASLTDKNPKVVEVQETIKSVEASIKKEESRSVGAHPKASGRAVSDSTRGQLITNMAKAQAESNSFQQQALEMQNLQGQLQGDMVKFPSVEEGLANIEQEERYLSNGLDTLKQKALEAHIKQAETLSNIFIVDQPTLPDKEKFPSRPMILLFGLISGFALGVGVAFLKTRLSSSNTNAMGNEDDTLFDLLEQPSSAQEMSRKKTL
jgi:uncharacterized protein involved in exopolysaccharide biosynthesis